MTSRPCHAGFQPLLALLSMVLVSALALGGCGDDEDDPFEPEPATYPTLSSPRNVLEAYEMAYSRRDTVKIGDLYDSTYTGQSLDLNDPGSGTLQFTYQDELAHVRTLATTPVLSAYLDLGAPQFWDRMPSDDPSHPDWSVIQLTGSSWMVEITHNGETHSAIGEPGAVQEFAFSPTLDSSSPTDTLWRIVRWRETGLGGPVP
ncbi:MAG TPA: hypothetical protein VFP58_10760 [Candidatus Eisenbacteria bacterium]|nr:hypothetical protein [Candidatus Eisenbacteria bacterium]